MTHAAGARRRPVSAVVADSAAAPPFDPVRWREAAIATLVLAAGIVPRLVFVSRFPVRPFSDFAAVVHMALAIRDHGGRSDPWGWVQLSAGSATLLSVVLRLARGSPETICRTATAVWTGLVPVTSYLTLGRFFSRRLRLWAALLLAAWPGQIAFCGVVAQDNWVILPVVASAALALRTLRSGRAHPLLAALFYVLALYVREEMMVALLPAALVAAIGPLRSRPMPGLLRFAAATAALVALVCWQRGRVTGRYTTRIQLGWEAVLGSYIPGARLTFVHPRAFLASQDPALFRDPKSAARATTAIVVHEVLRRPVYNVVRRTAATILTWKRSDVEDLYWSFGNPEASRDFDARQRRFASAATPAIAGWADAVHVLFLAAVLLAIATRNREVLLLAAIIGLKVLIQFAVVSLGRFFVPVVALEHLAIPLGLSIAPRNRRAAAASLGAALLAGTGLSAASARAARWVLDHEDIPQRTYRFQLRGAAASPRLDCVVQQGWLSALSTDSARLELLHRDPPPGETARARCTLVGDPSAAALEIRDGYPRGGFPGLIVQRVLAGGREVLRHDLAAEPGEGWLRVPVASPDVVVEIDAIRPPVGPAWGEAAGTDFRIVDTRPATDRLPRQEP